MLDDERLASALGFRVNKVYSETQAGRQQYGSSNPACNEPQNRTQTTGSRDLLVLDTVEESAPISRHWPTRKTSSSPWVGSIVYVIVLILLSASIFGLEVYRIREVNDLTERMQLVHNDLNLLRNELTFRFSNPNTEREIVELLKHRGETTNSERQPQYQNIGKNT